jgi:hypothetical protein
MLMLDAAVLSVIGGHDADANKLLFSIALDPSLHTHPTSLRMTQRLIRPIHSHPCTPADSCRGAKILPTPFLCEPLLALCLCGFGVGFGCSHAAL